MDPQPQGVKASGNTWANVLARDPDTGAGRRVAFLPRNSPAANAEVGRLAAQFVIKPIDLGRNDACGMRHAFGDPPAAGRSHRRL
ncbi:hypothetical protein MTOK_14540 [Mycolicibacterium tokaiense]|nr:hypothetical protein MTOK_14540 [Mycolicibacterium tokaiense]